MNLFDLTVPVYVRNLRAIDRWLDKAVASATLRKFDPEILVQARLAPDQFALARQIQLACDSAKWGAAKLAGKEGPSHPDTEKTIEELRARLRTCIAYLETFTPEDFAGAEERRCAHQWMQGKAVLGRDYVHQYALPNFYFHVVTAYAILRHNGVDVGKMDFLTEMAFV
jgi:hypothetical protein